MNIDGEIEQAERGNVNTVTAYQERIANLCSNNESKVEAVSFADVVDDIPPELLAASHPKELIQGQELPDAANSCIISANKGLYSAGNITNAGRDSYYAANPDLKKTAEVDMSANATALTSQFSMASLALSPDSPEIKSPKNELETPALDPFTRTP